MLHLKVIAIRFAFRNHLATIIRELEDLTNKRWDFFFKMPLHLEALAVDIQFLEYLANIMVHL